MAQPRNPAARPGQLLSQREVHALEHAAEGLSYDEIAKLMFLTNVTVQAHLQHARIKLDARNTTHAVVLAIRKGLITAGGR